MLKLLELGAVTADPLALLDMWWVGMHGYDDKVRVIVTTYVHVLMTAGLFYFDFSM